MNNKLIFFTIFYFSSLCSEKNIISVLKFLHEVKSPAITKNFDKIEKSIIINFNKPGFNKILEDLENFIKNNKSYKGRHLILGFIYELTESYILAIQNRSPKKFQIPIFCEKNKIKRIFDAQADDSLFEMKNINWDQVNTNKSYINKLQKQISEEALLAKEICMPFELRSNKKLPENWKIWLKEKKISFEDNTQSCNNKLD